MKLLLTVCLLYALPILAQNRFQDIIVETAYDGNFDLALFQERKVVVVAISVENLEKKLTLQYWDSIQTANPEIGIILIPANDIGNKQADTTVMRDLKARTPKKFILAKDTRVKKENGDKQHPMMQWLTDVNKNTHFGMEVESDVQIYIVDELGELYAVLSKDTPAKVLNEALNKPLRD